MGRDDKPRSSNAGPEETSEPEVLEAVEAELFELESVKAERGSELAGDAGTVEIDLDEGDSPAPTSTKTASTKTTSAAPSGALVRTDPLSLYLSEIRQYPVLSREEEHEIAVQYVEGGDPEAALKLVTANLRLVVMVAREYQRAFHNLLDLIQEGNVGLLEAVKQFDPYRGVRFPSYAVWWVRAYIIRYVMNNFRLVKLGTTQAQRRLFFNLKKERARLEADGFAPTPEAIADKLGVKVKEVIEMDQRMSGGSEVSAQTPLGEDGGTTVMDMLPDSADTAEEQVAEGEFYALMREKLDEFGATLEGRHAEIFRERLVAEDPLTLRELGERYGVSRERVRQMEVALKKKLREYLVDEVRGIEDITI